MFFKRRPFLILRDPGDSHYPIGTIEPLNYICINRGEYGPTKNPLATTIASRVLRPGLGQRLCHILLALVIAPLFSSVKQSYTGYHLLRNAPN